MTAIPEINVPEGKNLDRVEISELRVEVAQLRAQNMNYQSQIAGLLREKAELKDRLETRSEWSEYRARWLADALRANRLYRHVYDEDTVAIVEENVTLRRKLKTLGKQYGVASRTIHDLRTELLWARRNPTHDATTLTDMRAQLEALRGNLRRQAAVNRSELSELARVIRDQAK